MRLLLDGLAFKPTERPTAAEFRDRLAALGVAPKRAGVRQIALGLFAATVVSLVVALLVASGVYLYEIDRSVTANINRGLDLPPEETGGEKRPVKDPQADRIRSTICSLVPTRQPRARSWRAERLPDAAPCQSGA